MAGKVNPGTTTIDYQAEIDSLKQEIELLKQRIEVLEG